MRWQGRGKGHSSKILTKPEVITCPDLKSNFLSLFFSFFSLIYYYLV